MWKVLESAFSPKGQKLNPFFPFLLSFSFLFINLLFFFIVTMAAVTKETLPPIGHATAGSAGAMFALTLVYPLDM
jgi:hypothetical protein